MDFTACILKPRGPLHLGEREGLREGSSAFIRSDTLFSALCHCLRLLYGRQELEVFLAACVGPTPPVRLSSAFPFWNGEFCFPVPQNVLPRDKDHKRIKYVGHSEFQRLLAAPRFTADSPARGIPRPERKAGTDETRWVKPWRIEDVPKVVISRLSGTVDEGGFYHIGLVSYDRAEPFFLVDFSRPEWEPRLRAAINLMTEEGIGGYRSTGKGSFEMPRYEKLTLEVPDSADAWLTLSLYSPAGAELPSLETGWYDLVSRSGYVFSPECRSLRRKTVRMFAEGSVFPGAARIGRLVDVTPDNAESLGLDHRVWRCGLAFALACRLTANERAGAA
jgi:CRISPR-associated protein Csm4